MGLKEIVRERLLVDMIDSVTPPNKWKVLIVDRVAMKVIDASCRMFDIMEHDVTVVEPVYIRREPLPTFHAVYFMAPSEESINYLLKDFANPKEPQYAAIHLFFTSPISDARFARIQNSPAFKFIKTFKEVNMEFLVLEHSVFSLNRPNALEILFAQHHPYAQVEQMRICEQLVSVCATLGEKPHIRYPASSKLANTMAGMFSNALDRLSMKVPSFPPPSDRPRATLLLVDRSIDVLAPLLHDFYYQAMCYDLLPIENNQYTFKYTNQQGQMVPKTVVLNESDKLWPTLRHVHIAEAIDQIFTSFNEFLDSNQAVKMRRKGTSGSALTDLKDMGAAMRDMPQYQEMMSKFSQHINMAEECMRKFSESNLSELAGMEQDLATNATVDGEPLKNVVANLTPLLQDEMISPEDKLRLIMTTCISQDGLKEPERRRLMDIGRITPDNQQAVANLFYLGVEVNKKAKKSFFSRKKKSKGRADDIPYELSRYQYQVKEIVDQLIQDRLSATDYPYLKGAPKNEPSRQSVSTSAKASKPRWAAGARAQEEVTIAELSGGRVIVFIIGGASYAESRVIYELGRQHHREVILGSTSMVTPQMFLDSVRDIKKLDLS